MHREQGGEGGRKPAVKASAVHVLVSLIGAEKGRAGSGWCYYYLHLSRKKVCCNLKTSEEGAADRDGGSRSPAPGGKCMNKLLRLQEQWKLKK